MFEPAKGADPARLNSALAAVGFFREENEESDEWSASETALLALEREFGLVLPPEISRGPCQRSAYSTFEADRRPRLSTRSAAHRGR
ncbi:hypothetical protein V1L54_26045 [Streptomyces sp. TRM 70361]|uniref:hypothetical protein n=1 Tax=Streptomyces sp. TRM 70361 TaxID=3116553 RepID=UPI002E7BA4DD|nr:hypothetical protein [Streptomyces sp. TRM 70361]MEE1942830.1 hypothetical protein [Streptomyces sp. TRM 70361]